MNKQQFNSPEAQEERRKAFESALMGGPEIDPETEDVARAEALARAVSELCKLTETSEHEKLRAFAGALQAVSAHLVTLSTETLAAIADSPAEMQIMLSDNYATRAQSDAEIESMTEGVSFEYEETLRDARYTNDASLLEGMGYYVLLNCAMELYDKLQWARGDAADWERRARRHDD